LDVATGGVLAMYSEPSFDPNPLAGHDAARVQAANDALQSDPANPMLARAYRERYPPGSTFKVVTTAIALDDGVVTPQTPFPVLTQLDLPLTTRTLANFGGK